MIPYKWPVLRAGPSTLEKRFEIVNAIRTLAVPDEPVRRRIEAASMRRELAEIALAIQELRRECDPRLRSYVTKYSPDQPRVPAGNPDGGQWTTEGDGGSSASTGGSETNGASRPVQYAALDTGMRTDAAESEPGAQVAAGPGRPGYPIDLQEDEGFGHTIRDHVGKSQEYLLSVVGELAERAERLGDIAGGLREGSFPSLEAANKLVNSTVSENQETVDLVANGSLPGAQLDADFPSPTGYEAFAKTERSRPYIRDTYGVHVVIVRDPSSSKGYRVYTAFPVTR